MLELEAYENEYPFDGSHALDFAAARRSQQAKYLFASLSSSDYDLTNQFTEEVNQHTHSVQVTKWLCVLVEAFRGYVTISGSRFLAFR